MPWRRMLLPLGLGLLLRLVFVCRYPHVEGDVLVYGNIALNLLRHHAYGMGNSVFRPTLIRLPGYPAFLAGCFLLFGSEHYTAVMLVQTAVDLFGAFLLARLAWESISARAGIATLWLAALCPFTANYCDAPMTETLSVFCVSAALFTAWRVWRTLRQGGRTVLWAVLLGMVCAYAILLRPDGVLLPVAVAGGLLWMFFKIRERRARRGPRAFFTAAVVAAVVTVAPLAPWTLRNWQVFHVFQPLAPRSASDPGEFVAQGYDRWARTWFLDAVSNEEFFWNADGDTLDIGRLPSRAFDSAAQHETTRALLDNYNETTTLSPDIDARFDGLGQERFASHPVRSRLWLPLGRVADMWLRPRTEMLPASMRWWEWRNGVSALFPSAWGVLNLLLLLGASASVVKPYMRHRLPLAPVLLLIVLLRSALLFTLPNAEPRYTLECFPVVLLCAGAALAIYAQRSSLARS